MNGKRKITVEVSEGVYELLQVLTRGKYGCESVKGAIETLIDHAQQAIYRPGSWERAWLLQIFPDFEAHLERGDPNGRTDCDDIFQRPKRTPGETRR